MDKVKRIKPIISFEKQYLQNLVADPESCVVLQEQQYHLALHPYHLSNIKQSIKDLFGQNTARYDKKLGGILLGYENIKLLSEGSINDDSFFIHIDVSANFFLFKPETGKILVGVVNKKSPDHVGCLLYNTFNVSLPKPPNEDVDNWAGTNVEIGNEIKFKIIFLKLQSRLPYIRGEIILSEPDETMEITKKSKKRRSLDVLTDELIANEYSEISPKKKKKKKKSLDVSVDELITNEDSEISPKKKKKKKSLYESVDKIVANADSEISPQKKKKQKKDKDSSKIDNTELINEDNVKQQKKRESSDVLAQSSDIFNKSTDSKLHIKPDNLNASNVKVKKRRSNEIFQNGYENVPENKALNQVIDGMISEEINKERKRRDSVKEEEDFDRKKRKRRKSSSIMEDFADVKSPKVKKIKTELTESFTEDCSITKSKKKKKKDYD